MTTRVCLIDDEPLALREMELLLSDYAGIDICGKAGSAAEAIKVINDKKPDLIFLDIQLKETNAFDILEKFKVNPKIVFVTAYSSYATRAFDINALDYLMKPVHPNRLKETLERNISGTTSQKPTIKKYKYSDRLIISEQNEYKLITINQILSICADGDYTLLYFLNGKKKLVHKSMNEWECLLPEEHFIRIHRGTIINMEFIAKIEKGFNNTCKVHIQSTEEPYQMSQRYTSKFLSRYKA